MNPALCTCFLPAHNPRQQIGQAVSRKNHPPISNPARTNNVTHGKYRSRLNVAAVFISTSRTPVQPPVLVSNFRCNLELSLAQAS